MHSPTYLRSIVCSGKSGYGIVDVGKEKSSEDSNIIVKAFEKLRPKTHLDFC